MKRTQNYKKQVLGRDNFTCQKCKIQDRTGKILEVHHMIPLVFGGKDELNNLITLCYDCHHFAPNKKEEFEDYMNEEMNGTSTTLIKAFKKFRSENPDFENLFNNKQTAVQTSSGEVECLNTRSNSRRIKENQKFN